MDIVNHRLKLNVHDSESPGHDYPVEKIPRPIPETWCGAGGYGAVQGTRQLRMDKVRKGCDGQPKPARSLIMDSVDDTLNVILLMSV